MRIIAGKQQGRRLETLDGEHTRPPLEKIRAAVFNSLQDMLEGAHCLDLFAGSGSMGLEALSRGAASCDFVESGRECIRLLEGNLRALGVQGGRVLRDKVPAVAAVLLREARRYDFIFIDPPFDSYLKGFYHDLPLVFGAMLEDDGVLVMRIPENAPQASGGGGLCQIRERCHGISVLQFFQKKGARAPWELEQ